MTHALIILCLGTYLGNLTYSIFNGSYNKLPKFSRTIVRGHLIHAPGNDSVRLRYGTRRAAALLTATGSFQLTLPGLVRPCMAEFSYAGQRTPLYLHPGNQLSISLDFTRFDETLTYSGTGAAANNYLARALWQFEYGPAGAVLRPLDQLMAATTPAQFWAQADTFKHHRLAFLHTYAATHSLPDSFRADAALHIQLQWANSLLEYPLLSKLRFDKMPLLPATYFSFLSTLPLTQLGAYQQRNPGDDDLVFSLSYNCGLGPYFLPAGGLLGTDSSMIRALYAQTTRTFGRTYYRDLVLYHILAKQLEVNNLAAVEVAYPTFRQQTADSTLQQNMRRDFRAAQRLRIGQPAPAFTLMDNTGHPVSLQDLRGKVVYLDFWGTWCQPCMAEMPASRILREKFAGRDVVFVYIAVNDLEAKWQQVLVSAQLMGPGSRHLRTLDHQVTQAYNVHGFPSYCLIGRDGRLVLPYAPRPSAAKEAVAAIEQALAD